MANCADINTVGTTALGRSNRFDSRIRTVEGDRPYKTYISAISHSLIMGMVMATQNLIESYGTLPLPEAQVDRFLERIKLYV